MPPGRPPKPDDQKVTRHPLQHEWVDVPRVPFDGPGLDQLMPEVGYWHRAASNWWETVRVMPHCVLWTSSDWMFAATTALIVHEMRSGDGAFTASMLGQLTRRELELGMTADARRQQRIRYVDPTAAVEKPPSRRSARERRDRLTVVADAG